MADTYTTVATVTAIDAAKRKVTMGLASGQSSTYVAAKAVDLTQLRVGERIGVRLMDELALSIRTNGAPAKDSIATSFASATDAGATALFEGEAIEASATVTAIDTQMRTVTFRLADGTTKTMKAHGTADLTGFVVGDTVVAKSAVALVVAGANA